MGKVEIRPGVWMAYEDHWFGEPWTAPETVVMIHGNSESSRAWTCWVPHLARHYRVVRPDLPGFGASPEPADYGWSAGELAADIGRFLDALGIETLSSDRRQVRRLGLHAVRHRPAASPALALPVRLAGARQRQRQRRPDPRQGRPAMGRGHHAVAARQRGVRSAGEMVDRRADGQDRRRAPPTARRRRASTWTRERACRASPRRR